MSAPSGEPVMALSEVVMDFPVRISGRKRVVRALRSVSLDLHEGRTVGLVGESGSGKSTLGRIAVGLSTPTGGSVRFQGRDVTTARPTRVPELRGRRQMVFQDPFDALDPRMSVLASVAEPLVAMGQERDAARSRAREALERVGIDGSRVEARPHQFSGGQLQRIGIARAMASNPSFVVLDEPTASLDVSVQAQVLELLAEIQAEHRAAFLFISHNLAVVKSACDDLAVLYLGEVVESGPAAEVLSEPRHPYTVALLAAVPGSDRAGVELEGDPPSPLETAPGCPFAPRCWLATDHCRAVRPEPVTLRAGHEVACHRWEETAPDRLLDPSTPAPVVP